MAQLEKEPRFALSCPQSVAVFEYEPQAEYKIAVTRLQPDVSAWVSSAARLIWGGKSNYSVGKIDIEQYFIGSCAISSEFIQAQMTLFDAIDHAWLTDLSSVTIVTNSSSTSLASNPSLVGRIRNARKESVIDED